MAGGGSVLPASHCSPHGPHMHFDCRVCPLGMFVPVSEGEREERGKEEKAREERGGY